MSILTNFEEFAVFECRTRPAQGDKADKARIWYFTFEEYSDRWRKIWDVFSREAVWSGRFDRFTESKSGKRGTSTVDAEFLKEIEGWRESPGPQHGPAQPQAFPRRPEQGGATHHRPDHVSAHGRRPGHRTVRAAAEADGTAGDLPRFIRDVCRKADDKYNSGLFHFENEAGVESEPDRLTPRLVVDDKVLKPILTEPVLSLAL